MKPSTYNAATRALYMAGAVRAKVRLVPAVLAPGTRQDAAKRSTGVQLRYSVHTEAVHAKQAPQRQVGLVAQKSWLIRWMLDPALTLKAWWRQSERTFNRRRASFRWAKQAGQVPVRASLPLIPHHGKPALRWRRSFPYFSGIKRTSSPVNHGLTPADW